VTYAVNPTAELPFPLVYIPLWANLLTYCNNWDFAVDGSPTNKTFI